jgi:membrane-bound ClpP family serine protease
VPSWKELVEELQTQVSPHDNIRRRYLAALSEYTGRNTIAYYSAFLQKAPLMEQEAQPFIVNDTDKNGFMASINGLERDRGLDLILHTPGGDIAAAESLVSYLRAMFIDFRVVVPQIAMSAGTMIACASRQIVMGKHSSLGPIDPQFGNIAAHAVVEEFNRAAEEIKADPSRIPVWQPIIAKYHPTLIGECQKAIDWAQQIVTEWLVTGMFATREDPHKAAKRVVDELGDHALTLSHGRHIDIENARSLGLDILALEDDDALQDAVLTVHHACILTLAETATVKLIENQNGVAQIQSVQLLPQFAPQ